MINEILERHRNGTLSSGVPNPTLEVVCQLLSKAAAAVTPNVQRRAFKNTGLTVAVDGSEDEELSANLKKLFRDHGQDLVVRPEDEARFSSTQPLTTKVGLSSKRETWLVKILTDGINFTNFTTNFF